MRYTGNEIVWNKWFMVYCTRLLSGQDANIETNKQHLLTALYQVTLSSEYKQTNSKVHKLKHGYMHDSIKLICKSWKTFAENKKENFSNVGRMPLRHANQNKF